MFKAVFLFMARRSCSFIAYWKIMNMAIVIWLLGFCFAIYMMSCMLEEFVKLLSNSKKLKRWTQLYFSFCSAPWGRCATGFISNVWIGSKKFNGKCLQDCLFWVSSDSSTWCMCSLNPKNSDCLTRKTINKWIRKF